MWVDFHVHTRWSHDSLASPKEVIRIAVLGGLHAIAITDHNEIRGAEEIMGEIRRANVNLTVIPGEEVKTNQGDVIGLFITERIPKGLDVRETVDRIKEQGGSVLIPHPFDRKGRGSLGSSITEVLEKVDFIEIVNGRTPSRNNRKAEKFAMLHGIPGLGGSDAHWPKEVGKVRTLVKGIESGKIEPLRIEERKWPPIVLGVAYSSIAKVARML